MYLIIITKAANIGQISNIIVERIDEVKTISLQEELTEHPRLIDMRKLLSTGTFYFSRSLESSDTALDFDLFLCAQRRVKTNQTDNNFFWNKLLFLPFIRYEIDTDFWLDKVMCGYVGIKKMFIDGTFPMYIVLVSRIWAPPPGTKFETRGNFNFATENLS